MLSDEIVNDSTVSLNELFPNYTEQFLKPFEQLVDPDIHKGIYLDFELSDRIHKHKKISPMLRLAKLDDAKEITEIYKELYNGTYPYKEMEDIDEVRKMIQDPNVQWIIYQDPLYNTAGCITFVLDFENKRGYIRGFMLKKKYQKRIDITKAMIGSMIGMIYKFKDTIFNWYVENRTAHAKSQYSMWVCGITPIGFYPNKDKFLGNVESDLMQICYDEKALREYRSDEIPSFLPEVENCYLYSDNRYHLGKYHIETPTIDLNHNKVSRLKKSLRRNIVKDKFGYETITFSLAKSDSYFEFLYTPQVQNFEKTKYSVKDLEELFVFVQEFIRCGKELGIRYCEAFVSAYEPTHQKVFYNAGLRTRGYIPSWKFDQQDEVFKDYILFNWFEGEISKDIQLIDEGKELFEILVLDLSCELSKIIKRKKLLKRPRKWNISNIQKSIKLSLCIGIVAYLFMVLFSGIIAFVSEPSKYYFWKHAISALGSNLFTPIPYLFDSACILAGIISIPFYYFLRKKLVSHILPSESTVAERFPWVTNGLLRYGTLIGIFGGLGYLFVGIFSVERAGPNNIYHNSFAGLAFSGFVISIILYSINIVFFQVKIPKSYGIFGFFAPLLFLGLYYIFSSALIEWLLLISILTFIVPLIFWIFLK